MGWFKNAVKKAIHEIADDAKADPSANVSNHQMSGMGEHTFQVIRIKNGFLLASPDQYGNWNNPAEFFPDLQSLCEGMVAAQARHKLGLVPKSQVLGATAAQQMPVMATTGP